MSTFELDGVDIRNLEFSNDDVVNIKNFGGMQKFGEFTANFRRHIQNSVSEQWLDEGLEVEFLRTSGGGWQKGKLRLRLEFVEEPELNQPNQ